MQETAQTQQEEQQAKEFLKRAEIRTMRKDLAALREADALKERDKIAKIKTLDEQQKERAEAQKKKEAAATEVQELQRQKLVDRASQEEAMAQQDLKEYATEEERQQIFLLESEKFKTQKQIEAIEQGEDPKLQLEKNSQLLAIEEARGALAGIEAEEKKLEGEEKAIGDRAQITSIASEKQALEQRKWELDAQIQEVEKKRWAAETEIKEKEAKIQEIDLALEALGTKKAGLRNTLLGIEKSLRDIYSKVIAREEDRKRGQLKEQQEQKEILARQKAEGNEQVRREQRLQPATPQANKTGKESFKEKLAASAAKEEEERKNFLRQVEQAATKSGSQQLGKSNIK